MMKLSQTNFFKTQSIELYDSKIHIKTKYLGNKNEFDISYENILSGTYDEKKSNIVLFIFSVFFYLLSAATYYWRFIEGDKTVEGEASIIWLIIGTLLLIVALKSIENIWRVNITNNQFIKIYKKKPNEKEVNDFITEMFKKRNKYLNEMYGKINGNLNYDKQYNNYLWLKNMEVIDEIEFESKIRKLEIELGKQSNKISLN